MNRREAIRNTALILGYAVSASTVTAVLNGCTSESSSSLSDDADSGQWSPTFFNTEELAMIDEISEIILPATQTPGARDAEVYKYIDVVIGDHTDAVDQRRFRDGLRDVNEACLLTHGKTFMNCLPEQRVDHVKFLDREAYEYMQHNSGGYRPFFTRMKELTWIGYFTSELVGENYLNYDPLPGVYQGCIPLEETGGKAWSL